MMNALRMDICSEGGLGRSGNILLNISGVIVLGMAMCGQADLINVWAWHSKVARSVLGE